WRLTIPDHKLLKEVEQQWLNQIKTEELGAKYYNFKKTASGGNGSANRGKSRRVWNTGLNKEMIELRRQNKFSLLIDKPKKQKSRAWTPSEDHRRKLSTNMKLRWENMSDYDRKSICERMVAGRKKRPKK